MCYSIHSVSHSHTSMIKTLRSEREREICRYEFPGNIKRRIRATDLRELRFQSQVSQRVSIALNLFVPSRSSDRRERERKREIINDKSHNSRQHRSRAIAILPSITVVLDQKLDNDEPLIPSKLSVAILMSFFHFKKQHETD